MRAVLGIALLTLVLVGDTSAGTGTLKTRCCFLVQATASGSFTEDYGGDPERNGFAGSLTHEWSWAWRDLYVYDESNGQPSFDNITGPTPRRWTRFKSSYSVRARLWAYGDWHPECRFGSQMPRDGTGWMRAPKASESYTGSAQFERKNGRMVLSVKSPQIDYTNDCPKPIGTAIYTITDFFRPDWFTGPYIYEITPPKRSLLRTAKRFDADFSASPSCFDRCESYVNVSGTTKVLIQFTYFSPADLQDWMRKLNRLPQ